METLILEDFRCFAGRNEVPIRPLTLLVGENSTGKTSFLAAVRAAHDLRSLEVPDFNEDPFRFGSYAQIANDGQGEANSFMIGQQLTPTQSDGPDEAICVEVRFHSSGAQPVIASLSASRGEYEIVYELEGDAHLSFRVAEAVVMRQALGTSFGGALPLQRSCSREASSACSYRGAPARTKNSRWMRITRSDSTRWLRIWRASRGLVPMRSLPFGRVPSGPTIRGRRFPARRAGTSQ